MIKISSNNLPPFLYSWWAHLTCVSLFIKYLKTYEHTHLQVSQPSDSKLLIVSYPGESLEIRMAFWMTELNNVYLDANLRIYTSMYIFLSQVFRLLEEYFLIKIQNNCTQYNIIGKDIRITIMLWSILTDIMIRRKISINRCNISCIKC